MLREQESKDDDSGSSEREDDAEGITIGRECRGDILAR